MYITFSIARFHYETLDSVLPKPSAMVVEDRSIIVTYHFRQKTISGKQIMRVGLIKKTIESVFTDQVSWLSDPLGNGYCITYGIDEFYSKYCKYKTYPKWLWVKHRRQLVPHAMKYAIRLHEKGLFCFETVLGYMYIQNQRIASKIAKYETLEKKARWVTAKMYERIKRGDFDKCDHAKLIQVRTSAGKRGGKASGSTRKAKALERRQQIQQLLDTGISDVHSIAGRLGVTTRTIYNDLEKLKVQK